MIFFTLYDSNNLPTDHVINLETAATYLTTRKGHLYATLKASYVENVDYKVTPLPTNGRGRRMMQIMITPDCFKLLCMQSRSKNCQKVRLYFLEVEKTLSMYKEEIYNAMMKRVQDIESNLKPIVPSGTKGAIYVLKAAEVINNSRKVHAMLYKIGKSRNNVRKRLSDYLADKADNNQLELVYIYKTEHADEIERCLKAILKKVQYRKHKEVYRIDIEILKELINKRCAPGVDKVERSLLITEYVKKGALSQKRGGSNSELYAVIEKHGE